MNSSPFDGDGHSVQLLGELADVVIAHNTVVSAPGGSASAIVLGALPTMQRLGIHSNILVHGAYGVKGGGTTAGRVSLATYAPGALFSRNVIVGGGNVRDYPGGNFFASTLADVGIAGLSMHDYHLALATFRARGLDDRDIGADIDRVESATRNAVVAP